MVEIPEYFKRKARRQFGQAGPSWVEELPALLLRCIERWRLSDCQPLDHLSINLVCTARSPVYGEVVLKIQGPHSERFTEMTALELYAGQNACQCLECDRDWAVMLLERIRPGNNLRSLPSKEEQLAIGTEMVRLLPIPLHDPFNLPSYRDWVTRAFTTVRRHYNPDETLKAMMGAAWELFLEIDDSRRFLLHGDLHHDNILSSAEGKWKVIDPQGVVGSPVFECGRFIENHVIEDDGVDLEAAVKAIEYMSDRLMQPERRVAAAFYILHLLSTCWGFEMNYSQEEISQGVQGCADILGLVRGY